MDDFPDQYTDDNQDWLRQQAEEEAHDARQLTLAQWAMDDARQEPATAE